MNTQRRFTLALLVTMTVIVSLSVPAVSYALSPAGDAPERIASHLSRSAPQGAQTLEEATALQTSSYYVDAVNGNNAGDGSSLSPWRTITYALAQVTGPQAEIHIRPGVYDQALGESFPLTMEPGVKLLGADRTTTIVSGNGSGPVVLIPGTVSYTVDTVISGLKITNGSVGVQVYGSGGACSSAVVEGNWITANGHGIQGVASMSSQFCTVIRGNLISGNTGSGITDNAEADFAHAAPVIEANQIVDNGSAGIYCTCLASGYDTSYCEPVVRGNLISGNGGSGILCHTSYAGSCSPLIVGNTIASNQGWGFERSQGYNYNVGNYPKLVGNLIYSNRDGGAYFVYYAPTEARYDLATLVNNTIAYNNAYGVRSGLPTLVNNIIWGHSDDLDASVDRVSYSDIGDGEYGGINNNLSVAPGFIDPAHDDYHILPASPLRNAGNSTAADVPAADIDGDQRILGAAVDIGADETAEYRLSMAKSSPLTNTIYPGGVLTYTLTLTNGGAASASSVLVTDTLPVETAWAGYAAASTGSAHVQSGTLTWRGTLPVTGTQSIVYNVALEPGHAAGAVITNTALVADRTGGITQTVPVTVTIGPGLLWTSSRQAASETTVRPGQRFIYTLTITNTGTILASDVVVRDTLDSHVFFASIGPGGVYNPIDTTITWGGLSVPINSSVVLTAAVTVADPLADATAIVNHAQVTDGGSSFNLATSDGIVLVYNPPTAGFVAAPALGPVPLTVTLGDRSQRATAYVWTYGDGITGTAATTHTHVYTDAGVYTLTLKVSNLVGADTLTKTGTLTTYHGALAGFTASPGSGLGPLVVTFTNTSQYATGTMWKYGDGVTSTVSLATHSHTYTTPGVYTATLTALGPYNSDTYTRSSYITVYGQPVASFGGTPQAGTAPLLVGFNNYSLNATSYQWDFGDGGISSAAAPAHNYLTGGVYTVTLTASNPGGSDVLVRPAYVTVHDVPVADFYAVPTLGLLPLAAAFTNTSLYADTYLWNYGDGITSTVAATVHTHTYTTAGTFNVSLTAYNSYGSETYIRPAYVAAYSPPVASFSSSTARTGTAPLLVGFSNTSLNATAYQWNFGDGSMSSAAAPSHLYLAGGVYTVTLTASNPGGGDVLVRPAYVTAYDLPVVGFYAAPVQGLAPLVATFTNTSLYADTYVWNYGDGLTSAVAATVHTHTYMTAGVFTVTLTGTNSHGSTPYARPAYIQGYNPAVAGFAAAPLTGSAPLGVVFTSTALYATDYLWNFGDGITSTALAPTHVYTLGAVYTVSLRARNPVSSDWMTRTSYITVHQGPLASFAAAQRIGVAPLTVIFTNTSQLATAYLWDYGDGATSTTPAPSHAHTYTAPGVYTVTLTSSSSYGSHAVTRPAYVAVFAAGSAAIYYVDGENGSNLTGDGSQAAPWKTISYALGQMSGAGLELRVASGTYNQAMGESFPITMKSGISITGTGYPFATVSGAASQPIFAFPSTSAFDATTVLRGFKLTGGSAGVLVEGVGGSGTAPVIRDNWITGNTNGLVINADYGRIASPLIAGNRIQANTSHGLYLSAVRDVAIAQPTVQSNTISGNGGSGVYCYASGAGYHYNNEYGLCNPVLTGNLIAHNSGDGMTCHTAYCGGCSPQLTANTIAHNGGWGWGRQHDVTYLHSTEPLFVDNIIYGNAAGGALFINSYDVYGDRDAPTFINNTIAYNGPYGILNGYPTLINNIAWGHTSDLNAPVDSVSYCDVSQGIYVGQNNNISLTPQFVDVADEDYHLLPTSPAINSGNSAAAGLPAFDFDGDLRIVGAAVDMGADEFTEANLVRPPGGSIVPTPGVTITVPGGAFTDTVIMHYVTRPVTDTGDLANVDVFYTIDATYRESGLPAQPQPGQHYTITITYRPEDVPANVEETALALYYWSGAAWLLEPSSTVNTALHGLTATPDHFSLWAALAPSTPGEPTQPVFLPIIVKSKPD